VTTQPLEGLGADLPTLQRLCGGDPVALDAIDRVTQNKPTGRPPKDEDKRIDNINSFMKVRSGGRCGAADSGTGRFRWCNGYTT
jgi:hypothetical protein